MEQGTLHYGDAWVKMKTMAYSHNNIRAFGYQQEKNTLPYENILFINEDCRPLLKMPPFSNILFLKVDMRTGAQVNSHIAA